MIVKCYKQWPGQSSSTHSQIIRYNLNCLFGVTMPHKTSKGSVYQLTGHTNFNSSHFQSTITFYSIGLSLSKPLTSWTALSFLQLQIYLSRKTPHCLQIHRSDIATNRPNPPFLLLSMEAYFSQCGCGAFSVRELSNIWINPNVTVHR